MDLNYDQFNGDALIFKYNLDEYGNPISIKVDKEEKQVSVHGTIQLEYVPDEYNKVIILNEDNTQMTEVFNRDEIKPNTYYVDYNNGVVYLDKSQFGKTKIYNYYNKGIQLIGCSRIYDEHDISGKHVVLTLQEIIDAGREALRFLLDIGDAKKVIELLESLIAEGKLTITNLENKKNECIQAVDSAITEAEKRKDTAIQEIQDNIQQAKDEVINVAGNKEVIIKSSDWTLNVDVYEKEITHDLNSENLHVTAKNSDTKEAVTIGYKIVDKTRILLKSDEAINMSVILSASYYHATQTISDDIAEEVVKARKGEADLKTKIDSIDEQLDNSAKKTKLVKNIFNLELDKAYLTFLFDDSRKEVFDNAYPLFQSEGIKGCLAVIVNDYKKANSNTISPKDMQTMYDNGWEFLSHGIRSLNMTSSSADEFCENEIKQSKKELEKMGFEINGFVAPGGTLDVNRMYMVEDNYEFAFCNYSYNAVDLNSSIYNINRYDISKKSVDELKVIIDNAVANKEWIVFFDHNVGTTGNISLADLTTLIQYAKTKDITIDTASGVIDKISSALIKGKALKNKSDKIDYYKNLLKNHHWLGKTTADVDIWNKVQTITAGTLVIETRQYQPYSEYIMKFDGVGLNDLCTLTQRVQFKPIVSTTGKIQIPHYCNGSDRTFRVQVRAYNEYTYLYTLSDETIIPQLAYNVYEKNFSVPYDANITRLEVRLTVQSTVATNKFDFFLGSPCLIINNNAPKSLERQNVYLKQNQLLTATANSSDTVIFNQISLSTGGINTSTGEWTIKNDGEYYFDCYMCITDSVATNGTFSVSLCVNGTVVRTSKHYVDILANKYATLPISGILSLVSGDVVTVKVTKDLAQATQLDMASYLSAFQLPRNAQ